jgi:hypothetical protein
MVIRFLNQKENIIKATSNPPVYDEPKQSKMKTFTDLKEEKQSSTMNSEIVNSTMNSEKTPMKVGKGLKKQTGLNNKMPKLIRLFQGLSEPHKKFTDKNFIRGAGDKFSNTDIKRFYIDMKKFKNGLLCVKYTSNDNIHPKFRTTIMSKELKDILENYFKEKVADTPGIIWVPKVSSSYRFLLRTGKKL